MALCISLVFDYFEVTGRATCARHVTLAPFETSPATRSQVPYGVTRCGFWHAGEIASTFASLGFTAPTPIQAQAWPVVLSGRDLVGLAETGSGKTYAYLMPAMAHAAAAVRSRAPNADGAVDHAANSSRETGADAGKPSVLVLAPTRELAVQIDAAAAPFAAALHLRHLCVYGGAPKQAQARALRAGAQVLVATPGRLLDLVASKNCTLQAVSMVVLDEADRMLSMGFEPQVRELVGKARCHCHAEAFSQR